MYYELPYGSGIAMDIVILELGDGINWYPILNWGDGIADINTNIAIPIPNPPPDGDCSGEPDNCNINGSLLYNASGVEIQVDGIVPNGTYPYIRITVPGSSGTDGAEVDAIYIIP